MEIAEPNLITVCWQLAMDLHQERTFSRSRILGVPDGEQMDTSSSREPEKEKENAVFKWLPHTQSHDDQS